MNSGNFNDNLKSIVSEEKASADRIETAMREK
jgi:hypothetical protein